MSKISQDFINNLGFLYDQIHVKDQDFLNEESEYYDQETAELVEDILSSISLSMIYEGYSASSVISFLADCSEEQIIEKYLSLDENILNENIVSEEYIEEQLEILNEVVGALFRVGKALVKGAKYAKGAKGAAPLTRIGSGLKAAGTATERVAKQGPKASSIVRSTLSKGVQKVKDIAKGAKAKLTGPTAKKLALGAAGLGAAGLAGGIGGYVGAKMAGGGKEGTQGAGKPTPSGTPSGTKDDDFLKGSALAKLGGREGRIKDGEFRTMGWSPESRARYDAAIKASAKPSSSAPATSSSSGGGASSSAKPATKPTAKPAAPKKPEGGTAMQQWAKANPELAAKVKPGQSGYEEISAMRDKPGPNEKKDQTPTIGKPDAKIDTSSVEADIKKEQEKLKKKAEKSTVTAKESYDAYDIILEYLIGTEQVDTLEEAHYVMLEMDTKTVGDIIEQYENYLLEEEIQEWVNDLVDEGYDLSEYTWDDMVEYYVTEARIDAGKTDKEKRKARRDRNDTSGLDFFHTISRGKKKVKGRKTSYDNEGKMIRKYKTMQDDKRAAQKDQENAEYNERQRVQTRGTWDKD